jgi:hypothetical protein
MIRMLRRDVDRGGPRGQVTNFVPVSQEELNNPKPADWVMLGGNMAHWNYSPLDQITRENVNQLQLVWARQLSTTGGRAGTSPLIHDGIMYLVNPNDPITAIDAATGTRIWEYVRPLPKFGAVPGLIHAATRGPSAASRFTATRSLPSAPTTPSSPSTLEPGKSCGNFPEAATATSRTPADRSSPTAF